MDDRIPAMAAELGKLCRGGGHTVAVAESMTAGALSSMIASVSGSSDYFRGGLVCYAPDTKALVGVTGEDIETYGIYSLEVARGLASGVRDRFGASLGAGITGLAEADDDHPDPGAWTAIDHEGDVRTRHVRCEGGAGRNHVREIVAMEVMADMIKVLEEGV